MRMAMLTFLALGAIAASSGRANAEVDYPVCLHVYGPVTYDECRYTSIAQCAPLAAGRSAQCMVNPFYRGPRESDRRDPHHRRWR